MEADVLKRPEFWEKEDPVMMGHPEPVPAGIPRLIYFKTSGSTGEPKWVGLSRSALQVSAKAVNGHLQVDAGSCWALALPLEHVGGFGVLARARQAGCRLECFEGKWNAAALAGWLSEVQGTHLSLVPTQVHDLVSADLRAPDCLRAVVVGGGVLAEAIGRAARALGWPVLASYGMTEAGSQIATQDLEVLDSPYVSKPIGLLPCWDAGTDSDGKITVKGAALFSGILKSTNGGWKYEERRGEWFTTSDTGSITGRLLNISGRADSLVKILGELVDPVAVETELLGLAGISPGRAVVVAVPDVRAGSRLVLVHEESSGPEAWRLAVDAYHRQCAGFRRISGVISMAAIPFSPLGKPLRKELSQIIARRVN